MDSWNNVHFEVAPAKGAPLDQQVLMENPLAGLEDELEQLQEEQQRNAAAAQKAIMGSGKSGKQLNYCRDSSKSQKDKCKLLLKRTITVRQAVRISRPQSVGPTAIGTCH